jgi:hypothetical protein
MTLYATLAETKQQMEAQSSTDDAKLVSLIRQVSRRIDRMFMPHRAAPVFAPFIETRSQFQLDSSSVDSRLGTFYLGQPILALSGVGINNQTLTVGTTVQLYQGDVSPYLSLQLLNRCCNGWYQYARCSGCENLPFVSVTGTWGYSVGYANAWVDTLQVIENVGGINASVTSITVTDPEAANAWGDAPCLSIGNLLQIDSEWLEVTAVNATTNVIAVRRGVNGSTAAIHAEDTPIYTFAVDEQVKRATLRQAAFQYAKFGAYDNKVVSGIGAVDFAPDVLYEFSSLLTLFANW